MQTTIEQVLKHSLLTAICMVAPSFALGQELAPQQPAIMNSIAERFATAEAAGEVPDFQKHVVPLMGKLGCNGRACHGSGAHR